ncbi:MAG: right-handed parallel beta-helix repeat-containing protein [Candidatus Thermoplasmatota archaeon]|nr:right-handed parallel beta-helix repeat-containing protein [Candidatus Thermoplasmatota archaeon]
MRVNRVVVVLGVLFLFGTVLFPFVQGMMQDSDVAMLSLRRETGDPEGSLVLPSSFSWRDINGVDFTTPIRNQNPYPSCESFALVAAVETMIQYQVGFPFNCDLSEAHLFFFSGGNIIWGSYPENDTKFLKEYGVPDEACWPYPKDKYQYPLNTTSPDWQNRTVKITDWRYLPADPVAIKTALITNGPVPSYFLVYDDFVSYKKGVYQHRWGNVRGAHYMAIVGYNDDPGYWIVKNSWGTKFQDEGWINIKYGECGIGTKNFYLSGVYGKFPILYVDDDNIEGPWDGTQEYPYRMIQDAIEAAYDGYTIYVLNGTYQEHLIIDKRISLRGAEKNTTIIDGDGFEDVVTVTVPDVSISGFTVQRSGTQLFHAGIKTLSLDSNVTIENNIIQNNAIGVYLNYAYESSWNIVRNNNIVNNVRGIYAHWADNGEIAGNTIAMNDDCGIEMQHCKTCSITGNILSDNGYGIYLRGASNQNAIKGKNRIQDNAIGVKISESHGNIISKNNFIGNLQHAYFYQSFFTTWRRNYWDDQVLLFPEVIHGSFGKREFPWMNFDWFPMRRPLSS